MAKRRSASKARSNPKHATKAPDTFEASARPVPATLEDAIEDERARLMTAHSILSCVCLAMDNDDGANLCRPYYPELIELARNLVNAAVNALDSDRLEQLAGDRRLK